MSLSDKITDSANCFCDVIPTEDVKEFIRELKEDEVYYFRQCPNCV